MTPLTPLPVALTVSQKKVNNGHNNRPRLQGDMNIVKGKHSQDWFLIS